MNNKNYSDLEEDLEKKLTARAKRKSSKMKVSGKGVFVLKKIITKKRG